MDCQEVEKLLNDFVYDLLDAEKAGEVAKHLEGCETCRIRREKLQNNLGKISETTQQNLGTLDEATKNALLEKIVLENKRGDSSVFGRALRRIAGCSLLILIAAAVFGYFYTYSGANSQQVILLSSAALHPGTPQAFVFLVSDKSTGKPVTDCAINVYLGAKDPGGMVIGEVELMKNLHTDSQGYARSIIRLPSKFSFPSATISANRLEPYLVLEARSLAGEDHVVIPVRFEDTRRLLLHLDKRIYSPGESIHCIGRILLDPELSPVAAESVLYQLTSPSGVLIARTDEMSSDFGITTFDFDLSELCEQGDYELKARSGLTTTTIPVSVESIEPPAFRLEASTRSDQGAEVYYPLLSEEALKVSVVATNFSAVGGGSGNAIGNALLEIEVLAPSGASVHAVARTNGVGRAVVRIPFSETLIAGLGDGPAGSRFATLRVKVTATEPSTGAKATFETTARISVSPLTIDVIPLDELASPRLANAFTIALSRFDGGNIADLSIACETEGQTFDLRTDSGGAARLVVPSGALGDELTVRFRDSSGAEFTKAREIRFSEDSSIRLIPSKSYFGDDRSADFTVYALDESKPVVLLLMNGGLPVSAKAVRATREGAATSIGIPLGVSGIVTVRALQLQIDVPWLAFFREIETPVIEKLLEESFVHDDALIFVKRSDDLSINASISKIDDRGRSQTFLGSARSEEDIEFNFFISDSRRQPQRAQMVLRVREGILPERIVRPGFTFAELVDARGAAEADSMMLIFVNSLLLRDGAEENQNSVFGALSMVQTVRPDFFVLENSHLRKVSSEAKSLRERSSMAISLLFFASVFFASTLLVLLLQMALERAKKVYGIAFASVLIVLVAAGVVLATNRDFGAAVRGAISANRAGDELPGFDLPIVETRSIRATGTAYSRGGVRYDFALKNPEAREIDAGSADGGSEEWNEPATLTADDEMQSRISIHSMAGSLLISQPGFALDSRRTIKYDPELLNSPDGTLRHRIRLSTDADVLTIEAFAFDATGRVSGRFSEIVRLTDIELISNFPRTLVEGSTFTPTVRIRNRGDRAISGTLRIAQGSLLALDTTSRTIDVPGRSEALASFPVSAPKLCRSEKVSFDFVTTAGEVIASESFELTVVPNARRAVETHSAEVFVGTRIEFTERERIVPNSQRLRMTILPSLVSTFLALAERIEEQGVVALEDKLALLFCYVSGYETILSSPPPEGMEAFLRGKVTKLYQDIAGCAEVADFSAKESPSLDSFRNPHTAAMLAFALNALRVYYEPVDVYLIDKLKRAVEAELTRDFGQRAEGSDVHRRLSLSLQSADARALRKAAVFVFCATSLRSELPLARDLLDVLSGDSNVDLDATSLALVTMAVASCERGSPRHIQLVSRLSGTGLHLQGDLAYYESPAGSIFAPLVDERTFETTAIVCEALATLPSKQNHLFKVTSYLVARLASALDDGAPMNLAMFLRAMIASSGIIRRPAFSGVAQVSVSGFEKASFDIGPAGELPTMADVRPRVYEGSFDPAFTHASIRSGDFDNSLYHASYFETYVPYTRAEGAAQTSSPDLRVSLAYDRTNGNVGDLFQCAIKVSNLRESGIVLPELLLGKVHGLELAGEVVARLRESGKIQGFRETDTHYVFHLAPLAPSEEREMNLRMRVVAPFTGYGFPTFAYPRFSDPGSTRTEIVPFQFFLYGK
ncbi:MAG: zf-HC2 domain-containing protein [Planctomycetes bacterium]|nr:zf-HC2 domain-containing protein [Planctomycetota bacterium]